MNTANRPTHQNGAVDLRMTLISEKLKEAANYSCHVAGKWHGGGYTYGQLPRQRGFDSHLGVSQSVQRVQSLQSLSECGRLLMRVCLPYLAHSNLPPPPHTSISMAWRITTHSASAQ